MAKKIHREVYGTGKPVVLIHGWAMHSGIWRSFARDLAEKYKIICLDLPGHGLSDAIEPYGLETVTDHLASCIEEEQFSVVGWSLGATVAMSWAHRFPRRVNNLVVLAGNPRFVE